MAQGEKGKGIKEPLLMVKGFFYFGNVTTPEKLQSYITPKIMAHLIFFHQK